jgi:MFS family permease
VLFLTQVWHESVLTAGLWLATGPAAAAIASVPAGKLGARVGQGYVAAMGAFLFGLGTFIFSLRVTTTPDPLGVMTPSWIIGGIGVGMVLPTIAGTVAAALPPARFATGSAVMTTARQIGAVIGVALLIPVLGTPDPADPIPAFENAWYLIIGLVLTASVAGLLFGKVTQNVEVAPTEAVAHKHLEALPEPEPVHA